MYRVLPTLKNRKILMKKTLLFLAFAVLFGAFALLSINAQPPTAGGYRTIDKNDADAQAAAHFAVDSHNQSAGEDLKLTSVEKAERQIVAGRNFAVCMKLQGPKDATSFARAVVYQNLQQKMSLTSWTAYDGCGDNAKPQEPNTAAPQEPNTVAPQEPNTAGKPQEPNTKPQEINTAPPETNRYAKPGSITVREPIAGGYAPIANDSTEASSAAKFAIAARKKKDPSLKLVSIEHAEQQVVAGMNYAICMKVRGKGDKAGASHLVHAVVFLNLRQKMSLTSFDTVSACPDE
jgi:Aspartic acid proteinase inhibitor/Cystatin domain